MAYHYQPPILDATAPHGMPPHAHATSAANRADYAAQLAALTAPAALANIRAVADESRAETMAECRLLAAQGRTRDAVALAASTHHDIKTVQRWALVDRATAMRLWPIDVPCHGWRRRYQSKATANLE